MTFYQNGSFTRHEPERKAIRDRLRKQFFEEHGFANTYDVLSIPVATNENAHEITSLIDKALLLHEGDKTAIKMLMGEVSFLSLSKVKLGDLPPSNPLKEDMSLTVLAETFFDDYQG